MLSHLNPPQREAAKYWTPLVLAGAGMLLEGFMAQQDLPVLAHLRNTQNYVNAAFESKSLFDLPPHIVERDVEQWQGLTDWLMA